MEPTLADIILMHHGRMAGIKNKQWESWTLHSTVLQPLHSTITYGPRQANLVLIAYASSEGSGEPAHPRSLARTFAARSYKQ